MHPCYWKCTVARRVADKSRLGFVEGHVRPIEEHLQVEALHMLGHWDRSAGGLAAIIRSPTSET